MEEGVAGYGISWQRIQHKSHAAKHNYSFASDSCHAYISNHQLKASLDDKDIFFAFWLHVFRRSI